MKFKKQLTTNNTSDTTKDTKSSNDKSIGKSPCPNTHVHNCKDCPAKHTCDRVKNSIVIEKIHDESLMIKAVWNINAMKPYKSIDGMSPVNREMLIDKTKHMWLFSSNKIPTDEQLLDSVFTNQMVLDCAHDKVVSSHQSITIDIMILIMDLISIILNWITHGLSSFSTIVMILITLGILLVTRSNYKSYKLDIQIYQDLTHQLSLLNEYMVERLIRNTPAATNDEDTDDK